MRRLVESGVRLTVIGRRDRLPDGLGDEIAAAERRPRSGAGCTCGSRSTTRRATRSASGGWLVHRAPSRDAFGRLIAWQGTAPAATSTCSIRSGGEKRLSDFLLWECAYAELCFIETMWPDFGADHLRAAMADFRNRERRFGGLPAPKR